MAKPKDYIIGLDIGTNSVGWVVTDKQNNILRIKGKTAIGARLFQEGKTAAERRAFRTTRRRLSRRKWRLKFLEEIFDPYISKIDSTFFARIRESGISSKDSRKRFESIIFEDNEKDKEFYEKYPTIYHLRKSLMEDDEKHDLREIYLAMHHMIKYRGNLLHENSPESFRSGMRFFGGNNTSDGRLVDNIIEKLNALLPELYPHDQTVKLNSDNSQEIEKILKDQYESKKDKAKKIKNLLTEKFEDKSDTKINKDIATYVTNAWLGYKVYFDVILNIENADNKVFRFSLRDADSEDKLSALMAELDHTQSEIVESIVRLYNAIVLNKIVPDGMTLSESMVKKYDKHHSDLILFKQVIKNHSDKKKAAKLQAAYDLYVNSRHADLLKDKKLLGIKNQRANLGNADYFYKLIEKNLDKSTESEKIKQEIEIGNFLPKQRINQNGVIPYQLNQIEMDQIIEKQGKYYPFLKEVNPVKNSKRKKLAPYRLDELICFHVPYYVGPMITAEEQKKDTGKSFAWMIRKKPADHSKITPWNFDEKVDCAESADAFIKRMITKDTYLLGEDVLPASSLIYQEFTVLNELNNIRINGKKISNELKHNIINQLFKKYKTVSKKKLENYLIQQGMVTPTITGMADEAKFNNSLSTYIDYKKILGDRIDDHKYLKDFERIIEWSTVFEDRQIFIQKLKSISWITEEQIKKISSIRLQGWGRLSEKLLTKIPDDNGQNIMNRLWNTADNFMQIVSDQTVKAKIEEANQKALTSSETSVEDILDEAYTSPQNKKAIRQVMKVVNDIIKACDGNKPAQIAIEFTRNPDGNTQITKSRQAKLAEAFKKVSSEIVDQDVQVRFKKVADNKQLLKDKWYLYFIQGGRDAYTGEKINIDRDPQLLSYQIDHILPQSFIKDDSLDNRVLVSGAINNSKSDNVPVLLFGNKMVKDLGITIRELWEKWQKEGLISKHKLSNLLTDPNTINKYQSMRFINRQLVETSQVIKLTATIIQNELPDTEIIEVPARYNSQLRKAFNLYKSREVNDYHHAIDAYLTTTVGNYLYQVYPKLRSFFVYGQYQKFNNANGKSQHSISQNIKKFNFLYNLIFDYNGDAIYESHTDHQVFSRQDIIQKLERAYSFKYMLVTQEVFTRSSAMFDQTIYPNPERDSKDRKGLIPKKKGLDTAIYGGYSGNKDAYFAIVKVNKKNGHEYRIVGVPVRYLSDLKKSKDDSKTLSDLFKDKILAKKGVVSFEIICNKVPYRQAIVEGNSKFMLGSSMYKYNLKQLTLSKKSMQYILDYIDDPEFNKHTNNNFGNQNEAECLLSVYDEILEKVDKYLPLFDTNKFREKLHDGKDKFKKLSLQDQEQAIYKILVGLHANAAMSNLKELGFGNSALGFLQYKGGIKLSEKTILIYQSPTGLFERRVKLSDL